MKKWLGIILCGLLLIIGAGLADEQQPYFEEGSKAVVYDNDTVQLTAIYTENCEKLEITYSIHNSHQRSFWVDVPSGAHSVPVTFDLHPVIVSNDSDSLFVSVLGYRTDPDTDELIPTDQSGFGLWDFITLRSEGNTPKPVISVPEQHERKAPLTLTMPDDAGVIYTAILKDSKGNTLFELKPGEEWQAGQTYTISGNKFLIDDYYTLQLAGGKKRYLTTNSDEYIIQVGTPDPREPITVYSYFYDLFMAFRLLQDYEIIKPTDETILIDLTTYERPSRLEMDFGTMRATTFASTGVLGYDYLFLTASEAEELKDYGFELTLLLQEDDKYNTPAEERVGLYGNQKTLEDFCNELSIPVPTLEPAVRTFLILPGDLKSIGDEAFMGDTSLYEVVIQEGITEIGSKAFANSSVKRITLPASLQEIPDDIFEGCGNVVIVAGEGTAAFEWACENGYYLIKEE